ncbi:MAG: P-II family nitrogen regulator [Clostridiales bacterium]|nr:P-II family nitrogen regulator [Clostridiales bacterium]
MGRQRYERIAFVITVISHGKGDAVVEMLKNKGITYNMAAVGYAAIGLELADYFGLTEVKRDIIMSTVPERRVPEMMTMLKYGFSLDETRTGAAFCVPVSSVAGIKALQFLSGTNDVFLEQGDDGNEGERKSGNDGGKMDGNDGKRKDGNDMEMDYQGAEYRLIITIISRGFADNVIDAAKAAGARGSTIFYARGSGIHDPEKFMNIPIEPEKEIVLTLVGKSAAKGVTMAIMEEAGLDQEGRGICFAMPVTDVAGIKAFEILEEK